RRWRRSGAAALDHWMLDRRIRSHRGEDDEAGAHQHDVLDDVLPLQPRRSERSTSRARKKQRTAPDVTRAGGTRPAFSTLIVRVARSSGGLGAGRNVRTPNQPEKSSVQPPKTTAGAWRNLPCRPPTRDSVRRRCPAFGRLPPAGWSDGRRQNRTGVLEIAQSLTVQALPA